MPVEIESIFLDRKFLEGIEEREYFRRWVVDQFVSGQLERAGASDLEMLNARRLRDLEESERTRILRDAELHKVLAAGDRGTQAKRQRQAKNSAAALKLLSTMREKKAGELGKYRSE